MKRWELKRVRGMEEGLMLGEGNERRWRPLPVRRTH
jgi:hypothetical protein